MRAQIAMWILTKFALLFFIFSLAAAITFFGNRQRDALCTDEAARIARAILSTAAYVIHSPIEDERRLHVLEPVLAVGREDFARYVINLTHFRGRYMVRIEVAPLAWRAHCVGGAYLTYPQDFNLSMKLPKPGYHEYIEDKERDIEVLTLHPGGHPEDFRQRSRYLVVVKCSRKLPGLKPKAWVFIQNCGAKEPEGCVNFDSFKAAFNDWCGMMD